MKIVLLGYGRMGKTIDTLAQERGHEVVARIGRKESQNLILEQLEAPQADVAIDFSLPETAAHLVGLALDAKLPVVSGTTAWTEARKGIEARCQAGEGRFFYASNFSVGVYMFSRINSLLASLMADFPEYRASLSETHHLGKKDAPSGTAISLAEGLLQEIEHYRSWALVEGQQLAPHTLPIEAFREEAVPGTHEICYDSPIDSILLRHTAHSRKGFALGALYAAEWLLGQKQAGVFGMDALFAKK